jgi:glycosyltransferase involved in cell wall biosynthesis
VYAIAGRKGSLSITMTQREPLRYTSTPASDNRPNVRAYVASINTSAVTELCVRTMHRYAGYPFELVVGDGGSTDGSLEMLERLQQQGWLELQVAAGGRSHTAWLDQWLAECPTRYAVFSDSDVEYLRHGWLEQMIDRAQDTGAALVATRIQARGGVSYAHPVTGARRVLAERPEPWLMLIDVAQVRGVVSTSFSYRDEVQADGSKVAFDTAAAFFRDLQWKGLTFAEMPTEFGRAYHHYGSMSWQRTADRRMPLARRIKQFAKNARVRLRLMQVRRRERASTRSASG